jgi:YD repeat-containing protein
LSMNFSNWKIVSFEYDGYNRLTKIIDTYGNQFIYMYNEWYEVNEIQVTDKNWKSNFILKNK